MSNCRFYFTHANLFLSYHLYRYHGWEGGLQLAFMIQPILLNILQVEDRFSP